jgi:large subunit ribosomal protein L20
MPRVKGNVARKRRVKRWLKQAKGYWGDRSKRYVIARDTVARGLVFAYRDRKVRKREFRYLWISRINAACRAAGITYSKFISGLKKAKINLDRKSLADLAVNDSATFKKLIELAKPKA